MIKYLKQLYHKLVQKDAKMENNQQSPVMYTEEQLMARLKFFIGICLALTLTGIVFVVLYSIIFVTQPLNAISPIDQKFFELIIPIATFLTGTLSGIMLAGGSKEAQEKALEAANKGWDRPVSPTPSPVSPSSGFGTSFEFNKVPSAFGAAPSASGTFTSPPSWGTTPIAAAGAAAIGTVCMSSTGKPMPVQEEEPEL
jgi:hypothetical protein